MTKSPIQIVQVDYHNSQHARDLVLLLDAYATDVMGGGIPLTDLVKKTLVSELSKRSFALSLLAYVDGKPAGLLNAFEGFSTFAAKPLLNIHDVIVFSEFRGKKISQRLLEAIESNAYERGCCKITLEVLSGNQIAQRAYKNFGFKGYSLDPSTGTALFWQKEL